MYSRFVVGMSEIIVGGASKRKTSIIRSGAQAPTLAMTGSPADPLVPFGMKTNFSILSVFFGLKTVFGKRTVFHIMSVFFGLESIGMKSIFSKLSVYFGWEGSVSGISTSTIIGLFFLGFHVEGAYF